MQFNFRRPMVIELIQRSRRKFLLQSSALALGVALPMRAISAIDTENARLLAAWQLPGGVYQVGVLNTVGQGDTLHGTVAMAVDLPTRPHGLMHLQGDEYLIVARRPGDWILRMNIRSGETLRIWQDEARYLNGHSAKHGRYIFIAETDVLQGTGALAVRDHETFDLLDVWPTHGKDPHQIVVLPKGGLGIEEPFLLVANGGIPTHADMGRAQLQHLPMDSSLVALHPLTGKVLNQWTLNDSRLSLRHMAVHVGSGVVGIAMQAHHGTAALQHAAPLLALLDEGGLHVVEESAYAKDYAGDIAATPQGFVISCTKNDTAAHFDWQGKLLYTQQSKAACALASEGEQVWLGSMLTSFNKPMVLDNHWLLLSA
ncbi:MAG: DUF1513 domain-containing protein [Burkholderiales bacterium]|uniref:DUF1513 domain-containing protein n=1 Tax=Limnobacter sp. TaxID=2003368 RepID=UPI0039BC7401|nr:DUF1513 domain-containing protein [Burkholderiales bacterium]